MDLSTRTRAKIADVSVSGLEFAPDGLLYACEGSKNRIVSIDTQTGDIKSVAEGVKPNDLAVTNDGHIFVTETGAGRVRHVDIATGEVSTASDGIQRPNGIALSNDQGTLAVSEYGGTHVWMWRVHGNGELDAGMPKMEMRRPIDPEANFASTNLRPI